MSGMTDTSKQHEILNAAQEQFLRYGFRRVTMRDIAEGAKMSRPALYLLFPNKEVIFKEVFSRFVSDALDEIEQNLDRYQGIAEKLAFATDVWTVRPYDMLYGTPEGRELAECSYDFVSDIVEDSYRRFNRLIENIFVEHKDALKSFGLNPAECAEVFAMTLRGIKAGAVDTQHLRQLIANLINLSVAPTKTHNAKDKS